MEKNDYLYSMLKSEEHTLEVMASNLNEEKRRRHVAEKKQREAERRVNVLEQKVDDLQSQLSSKIDEISKLMQQLVQFMMGNGAVSLSESMKDSVIAGVRLEFEGRESRLREDYERQIAVLRNEINSLKNKNDDSSSNGPTSVASDEPPSR